MATTEVKHCDVCGYTKPEGEPWIIAFSLDALPGLVIFALDESWLRLIPEDILPGFRREDICNDACVRVRYARALDSATTREGL
jgi:hypothetical protein